MSILHSSNEDLFKAIESIFNLDPTMTVFNVMYETVMGSQEGLPKLFFGYNTKNKVVRCGDYDKGMDTQMFLYTLLTFRSAAHKSLLGDGWSYWVVSNGEQSFWCAKKNSYEEFHLYKEEARFTAFLKSKLDATYEEIRLLENTIPAGVL